MQITDLKPLLLVQDGHTLLKVSNVYAGRATFIVEYPFPPRTTVITLTAGEIPLRLKPASANVLRVYDQQCKKRDVPAKKVAISSLHHNCAFPMREDAIAISDCCQKPATSAVLDGSTSWYWRCPEHEGMLADGTKGRVRYQITER